MRISPVCFGPIYFHSYGPLMNTTLINSTYFVSTRILSDYLLDCNKTAQDILVLGANAHITCMFWFDEFFYSYGPLMNTAHLYIFSTYFMSTKILSNYWTRLDFNDRWMSEFARILASSTRPGHPMYTSVKRYV